MNTQVDQLKRLGLDEREARVYLAALEFGPATIITISRKSGIKRTTIYEFVDEMIARGLMHVSAQGKRKLYSSASPQELRGIIEKQTEIVERLVPELMLLSGKSPSRPRIRFYEGVEGIKKVFNDTLNQPEGSEILMFSSFEGTYSVMPDAFIKSYVKRRVKRKIHVKGILPAGGEHVKEHVNRDREELRESIVVPVKDFPIANETFTYQNKVAILSYGDEKVGIIIESQQNADAQRAVFNLLWKFLKKK